MVLFPLLGKTSAVTEADKMALIEERHPLITVFGHKVLAECHGYIHVQMINEPVDAGDHDVVICAVSDYEQLGVSTSDTLSTDVLRSHGFL